jgi:hypothetical protein
MELGRQSEKKVETAELSGALLALIHFKTISLTSSIYINLIKDTFIKKIIYNQLI